MNYKKITENKLLTLVTVMALIICVQFITEIIMWRANRGYKALYDESLESQRVMQKEINDLKAYIDE